MVTGAFVGFLAGYYVQARITGQNHGAGVWQRPSDQQMVNDFEGFVRWLAFPFVTAVFGYFLTPVVNAALLGFVASASALTLVGVAVAILAALYLFFKSHVLGR